jgi:hypothetical protein
VGLGWGMSGKFKGNCQNWAILAIKNIFTFLKKRLDYYILMGL